MEAASLTVMEFGPTRGIGVAMAAQGGHGDFPGLWQKQLLPRAGEIARPEKGVAFGVCRCVPGSTDGTFEYIALFEATPGALPPPGMVAMEIPRAHYALFPVQSHAELGDTWRKVPAAIAAQSEWEPYCGPKGCQCSTYPSFELYPWEPEHTGRAIVYVPVKRA